MPRIDTTDLTSLEKLIEWFRPKMGPELSRMVREGIEDLRAGEDERVRDVLGALDVCSKCAKPIESYGVKTDAPHPNYEDDEYTCAFCGVPLGFLDD